MCFHPHNKIVAFTLPSLLHPTMEYSEEAEIRVPSTELLFYTWNIVSTCCLDFNCMISAFLVHLASFFLSPNPLPPFDTAVSLMLLCMWACGMNRTMLLLKALDAPHARYELPTRVFVVAFVLHLLSAD